MNLFKDGQADDVILTGELAKQMKNDPAYVFDIPKSVKEFDVVPMPGNDRPSRPDLNANE